MAGAGCLVAGGVQWRVNGVETIVGIALIVIAAIEIIGIIRVVSANLEIGR